jgi:ATP-binding cassette, subfamily B, bacterial
VFWSILLLAGIAAQIALRYAQSVLDVTMANGFRERLFSSILRQRPEFFHSNEPGSLTLIVNQMATEAQMALRQMVLDPVIQIASFAFAASAIVFSFRQLQEKNGWLSWVGVGAVVFVALLAPWAVSRLGSRLRLASTGLRDQNLSLASLVNGAFTSPEEIQVFRAEAAFAEKHRAALASFRRARIGQTLMVEFINVMNSLPNAVVQLLFVGVAVLLVLHSPERAGNAGFLVSIVMLVPHLMQPMQSLSAYMVTMQNSWPSVETVLGLIDANTADDVAAPAFERDAPPRTDFSVRAERILFRYMAGGRAIFNQASFTVPANRITGLVARKGEGKTTFFRLLLRFYDPQEGQLLLGGVPTPALPRQAVREQVTMMSQFPAFFFDTVRENFRIAQPDATDEQIETVCRRTGLWKILEENVGTEEERRVCGPLDRQFAAGKALSGGQKKLFALTRCLLRSPAYLLLDEPTVGMDRLEEFGLLPTLREACRGKTVIVVNHDIQWLHQFCDHFIVLDQGKVVQQGGQELAAQPGLFRELFEAGNVSRPGSPPGAPNEMDALAADGELAMGRPMETGAPARFKR